MLHALIFIIIKAHWGQLEGIVSKLNFFVHRYVTYSTCWYTTPIHIPGLHNPNRIYYNAFVEWSIWQNQYNELRHAWYICCADMQSNPTYKQFTFLQVVLCEWWIHTIYYYRVVRRAICHVKRKTRLPDLGNACSNTTQLHPPIPLTLSYSRFPSAWSHLIRKSMFSWTTPDVSVCR